ncbi:MAG: InlB B-repeat-containing protein, partial [Clostridia bacterium]|nr:InlB B-repeat-containing protein [Clostridia bacterium]
MKRRSIKISSVLLSLILTAALLCCIMPFAVFAQDEYSAGDTFEFGSYPQSRVTDSALVSSLDGVTKSWVSYGFFAGTGKEGTMEEAGYMQYCDITYGGEKYRAVSFTDFRPRQTYKAAGAAASFVDDNGFAADTVYYFKFEPVEWRILDPSSGLMVTSKITDSRAFSDRIYVNGSDNNGAACYSDAEYTKKACLYLSSSVYSFLNGEFYDTAFTADEQAQISSAATVNDSFAGNYQQYSGDDSVDKVFLLSLSDISNTSYGFATGTGPDASRTAAGTDYAKILGLQPDETGNSPWWLRNAGNTSRNAGFVNYEGFAGMGSVEYTDKGIRPAIECTAILPQTSHTVTFDYDGGSGSETERIIAYGAEIGTLLAAKRVDYVFDGWYTAKTGGTQVDPGQIIKSDITVFAHWLPCTHSFEITEFKDSKCNEAGYKDYLCSVCGAEKREIIPMKAHTPVTDPGIDATCTMTGLTEGSHCSVCGQV